MDINTTGNIVEWFEQAMPCPTNHNRAVQIGCHYEEAAEMAESLGNDMTAGELHRIGDFYKTQPVIVRAIDRKLLLDSLCDQIVTALGVGHTFGFDIMGALMEVNRSNWSKFVDGVPQFNENGKIMKGPNYSPPDLTPFLGAGA